jgi:hypothetical protein
MCNALRIALLPANSDRQFQLYATYRLFRRYHLQYIAANRFVALTKAVLAKQPPAMYSEFMKLLEHTYGQCGDRKIEVHQYLLLLLQTFIGFTRGQNVGGDEDYAEQVIAAKRVHGIREVDFTVIITNQGLEATIILIMFVLQDERLGFSDFQDRLNNMQDEQDPGEY